jgi:hypothetical protein
VRESDYTAELRAAAKLLEEISDQQQKIAICLCKIVLPSPATSFKIIQTGDSSMAINGIPVGGMGSFSEVPDPPGSSLQPGNIPVWSSDDPLTSLTPSADGTSVSVSVASSDTASSFNLTVSGVSSNGNAISKTDSVPILPAVVVPATGFVISQTA